MSTLSEKIKLHNVADISSPSYVAPYDPNWDDTAFQIQYNKFLTVYNASKTWVPDTGMLIKIIDQKTIEKSRAALETYKAQYETAFNSRSAVPGVVLTDVINADTNTGNSSTVPGTNNTSAGNGAGSAVPEKGIDKMWIIGGGIVIVLVIAGVVIYKKSK